MNTFSSSSVSQSGSTGLRDYMVYVYQSMALALGITGLVAFVLYQAVLASPELGKFLFQSPFKFVVMFAPFALVLVLGFKIQSFSFEKARGMFYAYSALMGLSLSSIFLVYTGTSIARAFFVTAGTFAAMSLYGYTTKKDLTAFGSFLMMAVFGLIIASIVNIFLKSTGMAFILSILSVLIFTGLTAYDVQKIKETYYHYQTGSIDDETIKKVAIMGALSLYIDFVNIFVSLLHLLGDKKD
jgi:FtsH-binding integral membrane protein